MSSHPPNPTTSSSPVSLPLSTPGIQSKLITPPTSRPRTLAIIAHPWSRLGGNCNDPVVHTLLRTFLSLSIPTSIFNSRGAAGTTLRSSWNGRAEMDDYGVVAREARRVAWGEDSSGGIEKGDIYYCGYSYGSMLALSQPPLSSPLQTYYLAISPCPTFNFFLFPCLLTHPLGFPLSTPQTLPSTLSRKRLLLLHGENDNFCSPSSAKKWVEKLGLEEEEREFVGVEDEDHFWRGREGLGRLEEEVRRWVERERREDASTT